MTATIRAKALCLFRQGNRILVNQAHDAVKHEDYCRPLGGSIEFGETSTEAVIREIREELGAEVVNLRQVGTLENLFVYNGSPGHEIVVIFDAEFADASLYDRPFLAGAESNGEPFQARWRDLDSFSDELPLYPDGLLALCKTSHDATATPLSSTEIEELTHLEEAMWIASSRYDPEFQSRHFANDFCEFGRSGRIYSRAQSLVDDLAPEAIGARIPLDALALRRLDAHSVLLTYNSHVEKAGIVQHARRSSIWSKIAGTWVMRFHQGTPYAP